MKIALEKEMETLLIPLYGRAMMHQKGLAEDPFAEETVEKLDYDFSKLRIQEKTQVMLSVRSSAIDRLAGAFLREHPNAVVLSLGCGLDARERRLNAPYCCWYDLDFPEVIAIKRQLYPQTERFRYIASSVTNWGWMERAERSDETLVIAEGLTMYLSAEEMQTLLVKLRDTFGSAVMIFDAYSRLTAKRAKSHPSLKRTGAQIKWGADAPEEIEAFGNGIAHEKTVYLTDRGETQRLPKGYRAMFRLADRFKTAREAHRIFVFSLKPQK